MPLALTVLTPVTYQAKGATGLQAQTCSPLVDHKALVCSPKNAVNRKSIISEADHRSQVCEGARLRGVICVCTIHNP